MRNLPYYQATLWLDDADITPEVTDEEEKVHVRSAFVLQAWTRETLSLVVNRFLSDTTKELFSIDFESYGGQINRLVIHNQTQYLWLTIC